jgi:Leucine-rich repeat (LRR) protein
MRRCKLTAVPAVVERLAGLRILDLTNNRITNAGLPMGLARLPHLKAVGLKRNALAHVPRVLGYARSLQEIYLEDNADLQVSICLL